RLLVERDDHAVKLSEVDAAVAERDAAVEPAAADRRDLLVDARRVVPEDLPARDGDREDVVVAGRDVDDALVDDGLALGRVLRRYGRAFEMRPPDAFQLGDVGGVDLIERRVALVHEV